MEYQKMKTKEIIGVLKDSSKKLFYIIMSKFEWETEIESETTLLNGAKDWKQASCSGCFYVNDEVISLTLCNNSELLMTRRPNRDETWLDVQARALFQASKLILSIMKNPQKTSKIKESGFFDRGVGDSIFRLYSMLKNRIAHSTWLKSPPMTIYGVEILGGVYINPIRKLP